MNTRRGSERGQAIVLLAVTIVVLLGFTALAIDGGVVFSDRRRSQNAADAAALAGALQKVNGKSNAHVVQAITFSLEGNSYDVATSSWKIEQKTDFSGPYYLVTVEMTNTTKTSFLQMFYGGEMKNHVVAIARARQSNPVMPGTAIMAMGNCVTDGASIIGFSGGGSDAAVRSYQGGIFLNSPENGGNACSLDLPNSAGSTGVEANDGYAISTIGDYNYVGHPKDDKISPLPVSTGINGGAQVDDPLASLPEPLCTSNGYFDSASGFHQPGNYATLPTDAPLDSGIYCVSGRVKEAGNNSIESAPGAGVVIYMQNDGIWMSGNGDFKISAPTGANCLGTAGDRTASCTYVGFALFMARGNTEDIELSGNGEYRINGLVYHINGTVSARGGGNAANDYVVNGQVIAKRLKSNGHSDFTVTYNAGYTYWKPPELSLER